MKRAHFLCLSLAFSTTFLLSQSNPFPPINQAVGVVPPISTTKADPKAQAKILDTYGKLPLSFEANHGQTDAKVRFLSRTGGYTLFLTEDEAVLTLGGEKTGANKSKITVAAHSHPSSTAAPNVGGVLRMKLRNANPAAKVEGLDELTSANNYFIGNDPAKWQTNVPTYAKVKYEGIYSGIDLVYYGNQHQLEYDFIVAPGANPRRIGFDVQGAKLIRKDENGELVFKLGEGEICWHRPVVYQEKDGARLEIAAHYAITDTNRVGFELAKYDPSRPLYIDPLIYSTYLGGSGSDQGYGIAVDSLGNAYVTGYTSSTNFPVTPGAFQTTCGNPSSCGNVFVTEINPTGSALVYSTYLGGSGDYGYGIAVDSSGDAYVTGYTDSTNFPTTPGAFQTNGVAFVTKLNPTGSALVYSTLFPAWITGIAVDSSGNAYVTGSAVAGLPVTPGAFQTTYFCDCGDTNLVVQHAFVTKFNAAGTALVYSTYLEGDYYDGGSGIAVDSSGNAYVTGYTDSISFPVTPGAFQTTCGNPDISECGNAFVTEINPTGSALVYSTFLGGSSNDAGKGIAVDTSDNAYVTGVTSSTNFPVTPGAFQTACGNPNSCSTAFVTEINPTGTALVYSTFLGGNGEYGGDGAYGIAVDTSGDAYVTGYTDSTNFPVTPGAFQTTLNAQPNAFVTEINPTGSALLYSTYLGGGGSGDGGSGIAVDSLGNAYVTGYTSYNFPVTPGAFQTACGNTNFNECFNAFVTKIGSLLSSATTITSSSNPSAFEQSVALTATVTSQGSGTPTGTVTFSNGTTTLGTSPLSGGTATFSTAVLAVGLHTLSAVYSAYGNFTGSSASLHQTVNQASTTLTLSSNVNPSGLDSLVTFTATITPQYGGQVSGAVVFQDGSTILGSVAVSGNVASLTTSGLVMGTHSMTAIYSGDSNFTGSLSNTLSEIVTKATTATMLLSSMNPSASGKPVTFTAAVSSLAGTPTGKIEYLNGTTVLATLRLTSGSAKYTTSKLPLGANIVTAVYEGSLNNNASTSAPVGQLVLAATTTTLTSSPNPSAYGEAATFTAAVSPMPPDGETVNFMDGSTMLGTGTLSGGSVLFISSVLPVGMSKITAAYGGDLNLAGSTSKPVKQVVKKGGA